MSKIAKTIVSAVLVLLGIFLCFSVNWGKSLEGFQGIWEESPRLSYLFTISGTLIGAIGIFWTHNFYEYRVKTIRFIALIAFIVLFMLACGSDNYLTKLMKFLWASETPGFFGLLQSIVLMAYNLIVAFFVIFSICGIGSDGILGEQNSRMMKIESIIGTIALLWPIKPVVGTAFSVIWKILSGLWWIVVPLGIILLMGSGKRSSSGSGGGNNSYGPYGSEIPYDAKVTQHAAGSDDIITVEGIGTLIRTDYYEKYKSYYWHSGVNKSKRYTYKLKSYYPIKNPYGYGE